MKLGAKVKDKITGFSGTVTGLVTYITGCSQALVAPGVGKDGALRASEWFDEQRLEVDTKTPPIRIDNSAFAGPDRSPPRH